MYKGFYLLFPLGIALRPIIRLVGSGPGSGWFVVNSVEWSGWMDRLPPLISLYIVSCHIHQDYMRRFNVDVFNRNY